MSGNSMFLPRGRGKLRAAPGAEQKLTKRTKEKVIMNANQKYTLFSLLPPVQSDLVYRKKPDNRHQPPMKTLNMQNSRLTTKIRSALGFASLALVYAFLLAGSLGAQSVYT